MGGGFGVRVTWESQGVMFSTGMTGGSRDDVTLRNIKIAELPPY